jgi:pantoate--beta-alanine ligase
VLKLLNLLQPDRAYFGQKDFQQTVVVRRMVQDLAVPCSIEVVPTVREPDGLAMSSRNVYLGAEERRQAPVLYRCLQALAELACAGEKDVQALREAGLGLLGTAPDVTLEYLEVVSTTRLEPLEKLETEAAALIAARVGGTRLIDNVILRAGTP